MPLPPAPLPVHLYKALSAIAAGPALRRTDRRLGAAGIASDRLGEARGRATRPRPDGKLIWFHAASVGESLSALPLIERLVPEGPVLVTSGTATSAALMDQRLPDGALHQFVPIDRPGPVAQFLDHWRPDLAVFVESEIWPWLLRATKGRGVPIALINARLSKRSLANWRRVPRTAAHIFGLFDLIVTQDARTRDALAGFLPRGARLRADGNLKTALPPPPADPDRLARWTGRLSGRPVWTASSTHPGEDGAVLDAHARILSRHPDALCLLLPRHPDRGADIAETARAKGYRTALRSLGETTTGETEVYVADTMGETGLWYRVAPIVFLAGSFGDAGGHNPWEPVSLGAALLHGPHVANAAPDYAALAGLGAAREVADAGALADAVLDLLGDPEALADMRGKAEGAAGDANALADRIAADLRALRDGTG